MPNNKNTERLSNYKNLIKSLQEYVKTHPDIIALYIFGSVAMKKDKKNSDVDLALIPKSKVNGFRRIDIETELSNILKKNVDLVIFTDASPLLRHQILKNGHLVYENDRDERIRHEVFSRFEYWDSNFLFKEINRSDKHAR